MLNRDERNQIRDRISEIKDRLNDLRDEMRSLRDAQRDFLRESRKRQNRDVGYQGGDVDRRLGIVETAISELSAEKEALYQKLNGG